jgi:phosphotransferase system IIA component
LAEVPDAVFAQGVVGPGTAVLPDPAVGDVRAPDAGRVATAPPHPNVKDADGGRGVLVHLGLDTVRLAGEGFTVHVADGDHVEAGQLVATWSPRLVEARGYHSVVPVVALQADPADLTLTAPPGALVAPGDPLADWR